MKVQIKCSIYLYFLIQMFFYITFLYKYLNNILSKYYLINIITVNNNC